MPKLTRYLQKIFANNSNQVGVFGTGVDKETSKNVETLQSADYEDGWSSAIITNKNYPIWQEMDGVQYGLSYQLKYLFQNGMPEWLSTETYYTNQFCAFGGYIYQSLQDNNINHNPALNDGYWTVYSNIPDDKFHALKSYLDAGELLTDTEGLNDVKYYAHSSFDLSKFTVVGSPTITDDGIVSGFSSSNYIRTSSLSIDTTKPFKIELGFVSTQNAIYIGSEYNNGFAKAFSLNQEADSGYKLTLSITTQADPNGFWDVSIGSINKLTIGNSYKALIEWTGTVYNFYLAEGNNAYVLQGSVANSYGVAQWNGVKFGSWDVYYTDSTIDLKQFSITVDGVEVFSGNQTGIDTYTIGGSTVTIPYTLSKTGSKIVDSAYRTQVSALYNQEGYAPYYTLSDTDFTLPQGELYGMITRASDGSQCMPSGRYIDLTLGANDSTYTAPANGWFILKFSHMEQWSSFELINNSNGFCFANFDATTGSNDVQAGFIPCKKGDIITVVYGGTLTKEIFRFVYSVGSESEAS